MDQMHKKNSFNHQRLTLTIGNRSIKAIHTCITLISSDIRNAVTWSNLLVTRFSSFIVAFTLWKVKIQACFEYCCFLWTHFFVFYLRRVGMDLMSWLMNMLSKHKEKEIHRKHFPSNLLDHQQQHNPFFCSHLSHYLDPSWHKLVWSHCLRTQIYVLKWKNQLKSSLIN